MKDSALGILMFTGSLGGVVAYTWLLFWSPWAFLALQLTAFLFVVVILGVMAWIGYTLAAVPAPKTVSNPNQNGDDGEPENPRGP